MENSFCNSIVISRFKMGHTISRDLGQVHKVAADRGDLQKENEPLEISLHHNKGLFH